MRRVSLFAFIVIPMLAAGCSSRPTPHFSREPVFALTSEEAQQEQRLRQLDDPSFFGSSHNRWGEIILPAYEILLGRCGYTSLFHARTNTALQECRLILLPGDHGKTSPVVVRCVSEGGRVLVTRHEFTNYAGIFTSPFVHTHLQHSLEVWNDLLDEIALSGYWTMKPCEDGPNAFHEWRLFLEVLKDGNYHWVDRSPVAELVPFVEACQAIFAIAGMPFHFGQK